MEKEAVSGWRLAVSQRTSRPVRADLAGDRVAILNYPLTANR